MSSDFYIRWTDENHDYTGHFEGKHHDSSDWHSLSSREIEDDTTYEFVFHADTDSHYDTYMTFVLGTAAAQQTSWNGGAKVPKGDHTHMPGVDITTGTTNVAFRAWRMVSDDPKVKVRWSDDNQGQAAGASVLLTWEGDEWTYSVNGGVALTLGGDKTVDVDLKPGESVTISATDTSSTSGSNFGAIYDLGPSGTAMTSTSIFVELLSEEKPVMSLTATSSTEATTYKAVNLFAELDDQGTGNLPVKSKSS